MNIAVITDSNAGISATEAEHMGVGLVPMPFMIDGATYFEGIDLDHKEFYEKLRNDVDISTSQPSPDSVMKIWEEALKTHEAVIYIPMSSGLSGSCQSAMMLAEEYDGKVQVVNNQRISVTMKQSVRDALRLASEGRTAKEIKDILENDGLNASIYIMLDTLYYLKKGGRITPAAAALGTLLKLKPVLQIQGEKLDAYSKARTATIGKSTMIAAVKKDAEERFGGLNADNVVLAMAHSDDEEGIAQFKKEVEEAFPGIPITDVDPLSLSVSCHIGPGALALTVTKILK